MRKYILISFFGCFSMSIAARDDHRLRAEACDKYWKPIIAQLKEATKTYQEEWDSLAPWDRQRNQGVFEMLCKLQNQFFAAQNARNFCLIKGLAKSKEAYENR